MWQPTCTKTKTKYRKIFIFLLCFFESSYLIWMWLHTKSLYLTTSCPIYSLDKYLGYIIFYHIIMYLDGVLALIIIEYCYNMHIMMLNLEFLLEWSHILIKCEFVRCYVYYLKELYETSTSGSNFYSKNVKVKQATLCCTGHIEKNPWCSIKITIRMTSYYEKAEGLGGIMGGSITYYLFIRITVLKYCWHGCCFKSYDTRYEVPECL